MFWLKIAILIGFLGWMAVTLRPFCRWVCPLGALWSPFNAFSFFRLEVDQARCTGCNKCQAVCPVDIPVYEEPNSGACIRCLACVQACPRNIIAVASIKAEQAQPNKVVS
jgi:polyferredoxin